jgi:hypothetical protein
MADRCASNTVARGSSECPDGEEDDDEPALFAATAGGSRHRHRPPASSPLTRRGADSADDLLKRRAVTGVRCAVPTAWCRSSNDLHHPTPHPPQHTTHHHLGPTPMVREVRGGGIRRVRGWVVGVVVTRTPGEGVGALCAPEEGEGRRQEEEGLLSVPPGLPPMPATTTTTRPGTGHPCTQLHTQLSLSLSRVLVLVVVLVVVQGQGYVCAPPPNGCCCCGA